MGTNELRAYDFVYVACENGQQIKSLTVVGNDVRVVIEDWRRHYNSVRPHSSLNNMTPEHFYRQYENNMNRGEALKN